MVLVKSFPFSFSCFFGPLLLSRLAQPAKLIPYHTILYLSVPDYVRTICNFMPVCIHSYTTSCHIPYHTTAYHTPYQMEFISPLNGFVHTYTTTSYNTIPYILNDIVPYNTIWDPCVHFMALCIHRTSLQTVPYHTIYAIPYHTIPYHMRSTCPF